MAPSGLRSVSETLLRYSPEILAHWNCVTADADYQVAAFARDISARSPNGAYAAAGAHRTQLRATGPNEAFYEAFGGVARRRLRSLCSTPWRWLGERTPWMSYLRANPSISFVRVGDFIDIHWNNTKLLIDGIKIWTASCGTFRISGYRNSFESGKPFPNAC